MYYFKRQGVAEHFYLQGLSGYCVEIAGEYNINKRGKYLLKIRKYNKELSKNETSGYHYDLINSSNNYNNLQEAIDAAMDILEIEISYQILAYMDYSECYRKIYPWINEDIQEVE